MQQQVADIVGRGPEHRRRSCPSSAPAAAAPPAQYRPDLRPPRSRAASATAPRIRSSQQLRPKLAQHSRASSVFLQNLPPIRIGGSSPRATYQFTLQGPDTEELYQWAPQVERKLRRSAGVSGRDQRPADHSPQVMVDIDRDKASALGRHARSRSRTRSTTRTARARSRPSTRPTNQYWVILELAAAVPDGPVGAARCSMCAPASGSAGAARTRWPSCTRGVGPLTVNHLGPAAGRHDLVQPAARRLARRRRSTQVNEAMRGDAASRRRISTQLPGHGAGLPVLAAGHGHPAPASSRSLVIYLVLGILYESFIHPHHDPVRAAVGRLRRAAHAAALRHRARTSTRFVGIIMLIGIVKKNAIMMIDFALEAQRKRRQDARARRSTRRACVRFRPIMMTTMAALMGTLPIALGLGAGARARAPAGPGGGRRPVVSQLLTLYITPVIYLYLERLRRPEGCVFRIPRSSNPCTAIDRLLTRAAPIRAATVRERSWWG